MPATSRSLSASSTRFARLTRRTIDELCDPGLVDRNAPDSYPLALAGVQVKVAGFKAIFPDMKEDLQYIIASGGTCRRPVVLDRFSAEGEPSWGIPASGQAIRGRGNRT